MTFELRHYVRLVNHRGGTSVRRHSLTSFGISLVDFLSSKVIHAGQLCGMEEIVDFVRFPCVAAAILEKIADNVINGSLSTFIKCPHTQCSFTPSKFPTFFMNVKRETPFGSLCPSPFQ